MASLNAKSMVMMALVGVAVAVGASTTQAAICRIQTKSAGLIVGKGPSRIQALEDAREQCFDRSANSLPAAGPERETAGLALIDECVDYDRCEG